MKKQLKKVFQEMSCFYSGQGMFHIQTATDFVYYIVSTLYSQFVFVRRLNLFRGQQLNKRYIRTCLCIGNLISFQDPAFAVACSFVFIGHS